MPPISHDQAQRGVRLLYLIYASAKRCSKYEQNQSVPVNQPRSARCACDDVQLTAFSAFSGLVRPAAARTVQRTCPQAHYCAGKDFVWGRKMCYKSRNIHFSVPVDRGRPGALDKVQLAAFSAFCGFWTDFRGPNGATNVSTSS